VLLVALTVWFQIACSGGSGGGGGPTQPGQPGGGNQGSGPSGPVSGNVQGSVEGLLNPGTSFSGTTVQAGGVSTQVTTANEFGFDLPAGRHTLTFTGNRHTTRMISIDVVDGAVNRFDGLDLVETPEFNLAAFDDIYREDGDGTFRWVRTPKVFVDRGSLSQLPQGWDFFQREIIDKNLRGRMGQLTNGVWGNLDIRVGNFKELPIESPCLEVGNFELHFRGVVDDCGRDGGNITLGIASHCVFSEGNEAVTAVVTFNKCTSQSTVTHEIIHTLCSRHLDNTTASSVMTPFTDSTIDDMTPMDANHIRYMYRRPPGVRTPDNSVNLEVFTSSFLGGSSNFLGGFSGRRPRARSEYLGNSDVGARVWEDRHPQ